ncbi:MAG: glycosyltransferase family 1 protein [Armatimonadetes bacterium]|nr:glycosyltransferase family 1 protein [Armatimonadota bacterium]
MLWYATGMTLVNHSARIVLCTFGSLGDLHPYLALGVGLKARGHRPAVATSGLYREKVEAEGLDFIAVRPDLGDVGNIDEFIRQAVDLRRGSEFVITKLTMPYLRHSYDDLLAGAGEADLLVGHPLAFAVALVAETLGRPWMGCALAPLSLFSACDASLLPPLAPLLGTRQLSPGAFRVVMRLARRTTRSWTRPITALRAELGLAPMTADPIYEGQYSAFGNLALFSPCLAAPQPDWPPHTTASGFCFHDRLAPGQELSGELTEFLAAGQPPIVFTLGSTAVHDPGEFYAVAAQAAVDLGRRAVLLAGERCQLPGLPPGVLRVDYAPHSLIFPRAAAIVHQGGVGTTAQALAAGQPQLVVPFSHDQPDNASRIARLGVGRMVPRARFSLPRAKAELALLMAEPYLSRAAEVARTMAAEDGVANACAAIEACLVRAGSSEC